MLAGEKEAWSKLEHMDPERVAGCAQAEYWEDDDVFVLPVLGQSHLVNVEEQQVKEIGVHEYSLEDKTHFNLLVPLYLASCTETKPGGKLISPQSLPGGGGFFKKGSHELPTEVIAHHFNSNPHNFIHAGEKLGGSKIDSGDAAIVIPAFPKVPVTIILWLGDLEFPARAQVLLDETAPQHFPLDALWATIIMTSKALIQLGGPHH